jgi:hypothetical protein
MMLIQFAPAVSSAGFSNSLHAQEARYVSPLAYSHQIADLQNTSQ